MLRISEGAAQGIKGLLAAVSPDDRRGIRISGGRESHAGDYELTPAPAPTPGDRTVDQKGVRVFVDPGAAPGLGQGARCPGPAGQLALRRRGRRR